MANCQDCKQEMNSKVGCLYKVVIIGGKQYDRLPVSAEDHGYNVEGCHDCSAPLGSIHHFGCDAETCPKCKGQLGMACGCDVEAIQLERTVKAN